ncbi:MAG: hypothetical protein V2I33_23615, partial [Kangiellaceae bacterium]|nr:hypothetical protein [Kangiellaceae bacterium]
MVAVTPCAGVCTNCWGPGNYSCKDFLQIVPSFSATNLDTEVIYDINDNYLQHRDADFTAEVTWHGWVKESAIDATKDFAGLFVTKSENCPTGNALCRNTLFYIRNNGGNADKYYASFGIGATDYEVYAPAPNVNRVGEWNFVTAAFCAVAKKVSMCWNKWNESIIYCFVSTLGADVPQKWDSAFGSHHKLSVGGDYDTDSFTGEMSDVRYYYNSCKDNFDSLDFLKDG